MPLADHEIRTLKLVDPLVERQYFGALSFGLEPSGYDIRLGTTIGKWFAGALADPCNNILPESIKQINIESPGYVLHTGEMVLGQSLEYFRLPDNVQGTVFDKSTLIRLGLAVQNTKLACGWCGILTIEITNHGPHSITLRAGMPIAQVEFSLINPAPEKPYRGRYQDQQGVTPAQRVKDGGYSDNSVYR